MGRRIWPQLLPWSKRYHTVRVCISKPSVAYRLFQHCTRLTLVVNGTLTKNSLQLSFNVHQWMWHYCTAPHWLDVGFWMPNDTASASVVRCIPHAMDLIIWSHLLLRNTSSEVLVTPNRATAVWWQAAVLSRELLPLVSRLLASAAAYMHIQRQTDTVWF